MKWVQNKISLFIVLLFTTTVWSQSSNTLSMLQGTWYSHEKAYVEKGYDTTTVVSDIETKSNSELHFLTTGTLKVLENNETATYSYTVANDKLLYDYKEYKIVELTATKLTLEEVGTSGAIKYYIKLENNGY